MSVSMVVSVALILAWVLALCIGAPSLALAAALGRDYAFTGRGITRMGPPVGGRLGAISFTYEGRELPLRQIIAPDRLTMLIFR